MIVIVLAAVPEALRGVLTRWMLEVSTGVYVGRLSSRVRDLLWERVCVESGCGRAIMVLSMKNEQHLDVRVHNHQWMTEDFDGLTLIRRPRSDLLTAQPSTGWSNASKWRKYGGRLSK